MFQRILKRPIGMLYNYATWAGVVCLICISVRTSTRAHSNRLRVWTYQANHDCTCYICYVTLPGTIKISQSYLAKLSLYILYIDTGIMYSCGIYIWTSLWRLFIWCIIIFYCQINVITFKRRINAQNWREMVSSLHTIDIYKGTYIRRKGFSVCHWKL